MSRTTKVEWIDERRGYVLTGEKRIAFRAVASGRDTWIRVRGRSYRVTSESAAFSSAGTDESDELVIRAPMPGAVTQISVVEGQSVAAGDPIITVEAMKMEHELTAAVDGTVARVLVEEGSRVDGAAVLVELEER